MVTHGTPDTDRRVKKTKKLLYDALGELIREKPYEDIAVQAILDRANVGRSTFYTHFRDKDELLVSVICSLLESVQMSVKFPSAGKPYERIINFSIPVFEHIYQHRRAGAVMVAARGRTVVHERLRTIVAKRVAADIEKYVHPKLTSTRHVPTDLLAQHIAATFVLVLNWSTNSQGPLPAHEVNELFRGLIIPTLAAAFE